jgi:hypothetical protein
MQPLVAGLSHYRRSETIGAPSDLRASKLRTVLVCQARRVPSAYRVHLTLPRSLSHAKAQEDDFAAAPTPSPVQEGRIIRYIQLLYRDF